MTLEIPYTWRSFQATIGEEIDVPTYATNVTILPDEAETDSVTVTIIAPEETEPESEPKLITKATLAQDETSHCPFHSKYSTAVPSPSGESLAVYYLVQTGDEVSIIE